MKLTPTLIMIALACQLNACQHSDPSATATLKPYATLQELMLSVIDPNVDPIWNAVKTTITRDGIEEKAPQTDEEWKVLRQHAISLIEAANLLQLPGRTIAADGASTSIDPVEQSPAQIGQLIARQPDDFASKAQGLQSAAILTLQAIDARDANGLLKAGEALEHACEACHSAYWYPNDQRPLTLNPLGGVPSAVYARLRGLAAS